MKSQAKDNRDKLLKEAIEAEETLAKTVKTNKDVSKVGGDAFFLFGSAKY